jgi:hypothetical protein
MAGNNLTLASTILCPHGGSATLMTGNLRVNADGTAMLLESDIHPVVGCPFTVGTKYSPCIRIEWSAGAAQVSVDGTPVLVQSSIGQCLNGEGAPQGVAVIANTQIKAAAR